MCEWLMGRN
ncbi:hypothetical protein E2C01_096164 [Portunus trituberculatus]|uniref:Uncharacterized protein n=1 Tax=Portunus trituberculatus TaxID=210409 RepID=A0A5B7K1C4_PORTR|nr:hypothetical protein [Portunus trituberculatus]